MGDEVPQAGVAIDGLGDGGEGVAVPQGVARRGGALAVAGGREIRLVGIGRGGAGDSVGLEHAGGVVDRRLVEDAGGVGDVGVAIVADLADQAVVEVVVEGFGGRGAAARGESCNY